MSGPTMTLQEGSAWVRSLARTLPTAARVGLYSAGLRLVSDLQTDAGLPFDKGHYRAGWRCQQTPQGADIFNVTLQGLLIEEGVRGANVKIGRAMITALMEWAKRHGLGVTYQFGAKVGKLAKSKGGSGKQYWTKTLMKVKPTEEILRGIAWAIAKNIQKRGLYRRPDGSHGGLFPLRKLFDQKARLYMEQEIKREVLRYVGGQ
jgi:hypothetical protein